MGLRAVCDETMKGDEAMKGFVGLSHCGSPTGGSGRFLQSGYNIVMADGQPP